MVTALTLWGAFAGVPESAPCLQAAQTGPEDCPARVRCRRRPLRGRVEIKPAVGRGVSRKKMANRLGCSGRNERSIRSEMNTGRMLVGAMRRLRFSMDLREHLRGADPRPGVCHIILTSRDRGSRKWLIEYGHGAWREFGSACGGQTGVASTRCLRASGFPGSGRRSRQSPSSGRSQAGWLSGGRQADSGGVARAEPAHPAGAFGNADPEPGKALTPQGPHDFDLPARKTPLPAKAFESLGASAVRIVSGGLLVGIRLTGC